MTRNTFVRENLNWQNRYIKATQFNLENLVFISTTYQGIWYNEKRFHPEISLARFWKTVMQYEQFYHHQHHRYHYQCYQESSSSSMLKKITIIRDS